MYMLLKIIYKNFKSNIRKYILFFVSNIMAVAELFIFWGLNDVVVRAVTEPSIMMGIKSDFMIAVGLITVINQFQVFHEGSDIFVGNKLSGITNLMYNTSLDFR